MQPFTIIESRGRDRLNGVPSIQRAFADAPFQERTPMGIALNPEQSRHLKEIELEILWEVDRICRENGISYFLDSGTMLGAARHGGFIPWDDDIDLGMIRDDYERFCAIAQGQLGDGYFLQTPMTDPQSPYGFAKVRKEGTVFIENASIQSRHRGIWVDIFPYDAVRYDQANLDAKFKRYRRIDKCMWLRNVPSYGKNTDMSPVQRIARRIVRLPLCLLPKRHYTRAINRLGDRADGADIRFTCYLTANAKSLPCYSRDDMFPLRHMEFEGRQAPVLKCWERFLEDLYGDWWQLPPADQRVSHEVIALDFGD